MFGILFCLNLIFWGLHDHPVFHLRAPHKNDQARRGINSGVFWGGGVNKTGNFVT